MRERGAHRNRAADHSPRLQLLAAALGCRNECARSTPAQSQADESCPPISEQTMNASHPLPDAPMRRVSQALRARSAPLERASARRFSIALACLGVSYALAWFELPLAQFASQFASIPAQSDAPVSSSLMAALTARIIVGVLYSFVALRHAWARWLTVALCLASAVFVSPLLPLEWRTFPLGAAVTFLELAAKLCAAVLLALPLRIQLATRP